MSFDIRVASDELELRVTGAETLIAELDGPASSHVLWAGMGFTGVLALASCLLPVALGAAAIWLEGAGIVLILFALAALLFSVWRHRRRVAPTG